MSRCSDPAVDQLKRNSQTIRLNGGWRLAKTRAPSGGAEAISLIHTAEAARSDDALAGLTLRCNSSRLEVLVIMLDPLLKPTNPTITLTAGASRTAITATVTQGGMALLLAEPAASMVKSVWQKASELSIEIAGERSSIRGVVTMTGLADALPLLTSHCVQNR